MSSQAFKKLEGIQQKIGQLRQEQVLAEQAVATELLGILKGLNALQWDFKVLVGGLVEMVEKAKGLEGREALHQAGASFLKGKRLGNTKTGHLSTKQEAKPETQDALEQV